MAFCSKCGGSLDSEARFCPKCGNSVDTSPASQKPKKHGMKPIIKIPLIVFGCFMALGVLSEVLDPLINGNNSNSPTNNGIVSTAGTTTNAPTTNPVNSTIATTTAGFDVIKIDSIALVQAYHDNEVAADLKYKGKTIEMTGIVSSIHTDSFTGAPYVVIEAKGIFAQVFCYFLSNQTTNLASLKKDQSIVIRGICDGSGLGGVDLKSCTLVN